MLEGTIAGVIGATVVAVWFLGVDFFQGRPFQAPAALGHGLLHATGLSGTDSFVWNVIAYTLFHYAAFIIAGIAVAAILRRADSHPALLAGAFLLFVVFEAGFLVLTTVLPASRAVGLPSWLLISVANILAALAMGAFLWRSHPALGRQLDHALSGRENPS